MRFLPAMQLSIENRFLIIENDEDSDSTLTVYGPIGSMGDSIELIEQAEHYPNPFTAINALIELDKPSRVRRIAPAPQWVERKIMSFADFELIHLFQIGRLYAIMTNSSFHSSGQTMAEALKRY